MTSGPGLSRDLWRHAGTRPDAVAVRDAAGAHSYSQVDRAADAMAAGLAASGVEPGDRVALLLDPSAGAIVTLCAIARAGAVAVPLGTRLTRREIGEAIAETAPRVVLRGVGRAAEADGHGVPAVTPGELADRAAAAPAAGAERLSLPRQPDSDAAPAVAVLTSGTTGRPKAVLLSHGAMAASAAAWLAVLPPATGWLLCLGLDHVAGLGVAWRAFTAGVPLTIVAPFDPVGVLAALAGAPGAPSHLSLVPTQLDRLLAIGEVAPPAVRAVLLGGGPIPPDLVARAAGAGWQVVPTYGLSEAGSGVTALPSVEAAFAPSSAGRPLPGVRVRIVGVAPAEGAGADVVVQAGGVARAGGVAPASNIVPAGDVGEIEVRTPAAFSGYIGRPEETAAAFTADSWLRSGDLGRLDGAGRLFVVDRRVDRIVSGGENVSPAEVEAILLAHPALADAGVVGRPDSAWGAVPVAAIVLRPGASDPGVTELRDWCRERLAPFKVPAAFARLDALPRTGSGKLRRRALRERLVPLVILLHATLSNGRQLGALAKEVAADGACRVVAPDRRGSGGRRLHEPRPVAIDEHLADLAELLDAEGVERAVLVGHSFGAALALEAAARIPDRVAGVVAYEPPYAPVAPPPLRAAFRALAGATADAFATGGQAAAAQVFVEGIGGPGAWSALPERTRAYLVREGAGALADAGLTGFEPAGLGRIACPVTILVGSASEPFYRPIADALVARIAGTRLVECAGLRHTAPITEPVAVAAAVRGALGAAGLLPLATVGGPSQPVEGPA